MPRFILLLIVPALLVLTACQSDDNNSEAVAPAPAEVTVYKNWVKQQNKANETVFKLAELAEVAEKTGDIPAYFKNGSLMSREERDNIQHGYVYPLYFIGEAESYPARQWEDGYTLFKDRASDQDEADKIQMIREDMSDYWGEEAFNLFFAYLTQYALIDVRHYSLKKAPPGIAQTCFTVAFRTHSRGAVNYCYAGHRLLMNNDKLPEITWSMNPSSSAQLDAIEAFKLLVVANAAHELIFINENNRKLRDIFVTNERLSTQMHQANDEFDGIFQQFLDGQAYLNGRQ